MNYKIILDEAILDDYIARLPELAKDEVWYVCLFGRHKYDELFPNSRDSNQLSRVVVRHNSELKERLRRLESPVGSYTRDGVVASQKCLAVYITVNSRSLTRANKSMLIEVATKFSEGDTSFNPITLSNTCIHRAVGTKRIADFDIDTVDGIDECLRIIKTVLPDKQTYRVLRTRGGIHVQVYISRTAVLDRYWYQKLSQLSDCDVVGTDTMMPIPGCTQGGFTPHFIEIGD